MLVGTGTIRATGSASSKQTESWTPGMGWMPSLELLGEFERAEEIVGVGQRQSGLPVGFRQLRQLADFQRAFQQRIGRMTCRCTKPIS